MRKKSILFLALLGFFILIFRFLIIDWFIQLSQPLFSFFSPVNTPPSAKIIQLKNTLSKSYSKQQYCGNTFFPLVAGSYWHYLIKKDNQEEALIIKVPESKNDTRPLNITSTLLPDFTLVAESSCTPQGIILNNINFFDLFNKGPAITTPLDANGIFLPKQMDSVTYWHFELKTKNEFKNTDFNNQTPYEESLLGVFKNLGAEEIDTSLGHFRATHVNISWQKTDTPLTVNAPSEKENQTTTEGSAPENIPENPSATESYFQDIWLVDQIGIVRSLISQSQKPDIILELKGFQIPALK